MASARPKLLVLDGPFVPGAELARVLGDRYDVAVADGVMTASTLAGGTFQVVFAGAGQLAGREGPLSDRDAAAMLSAIGEGISLVGADGRIVWANERFKQLDEQTRARIGTICRRAALRFNEQLKDLPASVAAAATPTPVRCDVASPDESRYYEIVVSPIIETAELTPSVAEIDGKPSPSAPASPPAPPTPAASLPAASAGAGATAAVAADSTVVPAPAAPVGPVHRVAVVVWDVTPARRRQQKIAAIDRAGSELVRLDAEQIRKMQVFERLKLLQEKIVKSSHDLLHFDHLAIRLIDERTGKLELVMASGLSPEAMDVELFAKREGNGIMGYVAATGESYLCNDVLLDPKYVVGIENARSSLTVPLRLSDKVIGAFNVESEKIGAFTDEDRQFAEMFANHMALALHILDLLVVERCQTGASVTDTVEDELDEPLTDILKEADWLRNSSGGDAKLREHIDRIMADVEAIRTRVREAAEGPQHILGAEMALVDLAVDPVLAGKRVLVADDEPKIRQTIRDALRARGCTVVICEDGAKAIEELEKAAAAASSPYAAVGSGGRFDLLVSDIRMPDKNGYEVFSAARRLSPGIPAILMTGFGYDPHHSIVRASQEGLQCVLFKPFQLERLLEEVKKALGATAG